MLEVEELEAAYGESRILFGLDFAIAPGEVVTLLGRNGMGKTTTVNTLFGLVPVRAGTIRIDGVDMTRAAPQARALAGLGLVPEGRQVFPTLSVEENLIATARHPGANGGRWTLRRIYELFPRLAERRRNMGDQLSGGEQQMLAIGRALMTNPRLIVLDEATEGLAPLIRADIWACLHLLKSQGEAILLIDKNIDALLDLADRHMVLEKGRIVWRGDSVALRAAPDIRDAYLAV